MNESPSAHKSQSENTGAIVGIYLLAGLMKAITRQVLTVRAFPTYNANVNAQRSYSAQILLGPAQFFTKVSLLLLYLRLFSPSLGARRALYCATAFAFCLYWINIPVNSYYCTPRPGKPWTLSENEGCAKTILLAPIQGTLNVLLDIFILVAPISVIARLKMSRKRKFGVLAVFMTGTL